MNQPKDYAEPTTSYSCDSEPCVVEIAVYCSIAFLGGFYLPTAAMISLSLLKIVEMAREQS